MLISRFMINLRTVSSEALNHSGCNSDQGQGKSTVRFRMSQSVLGNIGETLQSGWDDNEPRDEEDDIEEVDGARRGENDAEV
ncbi:uncharacterized protein PHACADRAFT_251419, partial [Phanerochaete carnosa HHB-10118-sp]